MSVWITRLLSPVPWSPHGQTGHHGGWKSCLHEWGWGCGQTGVATQETIKITFPKPAIRSSRSQLSRPSGKQMRNV